MHALDLNQYYLWKNQAFAVTGEKHKFITDVHILLKCAFSWFCTFLCLFHHLHVSQCKNLHSVPFFMTSFSMSNVFLIKCAVYADITFQIYKFYTVLELAYFQKERCRSLHWIVNITSHCRCMPIGTSLTNRCIAFFFCIQEFQEFKIFCIQEFTLFRKHMYYYNSFEMLHIQMS